MGVNEFGYDYLKHHASQLTGYVKIKMNLKSALALAALSPYPDGVKIGVMKQIANTKEITLEQMRFLLGWAARKSQAQK